MNETHWMWRRKKENKRLEENRKNEQKAQGRNKKRIKYDPENREGVSRAMTPDVH